MANDPSERADRPPSCPLLGGLCCKTRMYLRTWFRREFLRCPFCRASIEGVAAFTHRHQNLRHPLRRTNGCRQWRWSAEELDEPLQVLRGSGEQNLVSCAAQAPQSKPVEPQDALHMGKSHLDLLTFAA